MSGPIDLLNTMPAEERRRICALAAEAADRVLCASGGPMMQADRESAQRAYEGTIASEVATYRARAQTDERALLRSRIEVFLGTAPLREVQLLAQLVDRIEATREDYAQAVSINGDRALGVAGRRALLDLYIADTVAGGEE